MDHCVKLCQTSQTVCASRSAPNSILIYNRSYEFFVLQHVLTVTGLLVSLIAHLQVDLEQGIKYFYASAAAWGLSIVIRGLITFVSIAGLGRFRGVARMKQLPGGVTQVDIETTGKQAWRAGQHVYIRLTKLNPFVRKAFEHDFEH